MSVEAWSTVSYNNTLDTLTLNISPLVGYNVKFWLPVSSLAIHVKVASNNIYMYSHNIYAETELNANYPRHCDRRRLSASIVLGMYNVTALE